MSNKSLTHCRILVTRPETSAKELCDLIEAAGGTAIHFPVLRIIAIEPNLIADEFGQITNPDIVIFVSKNAVKHGLNILGIEKSKLAAIGPTTVAAIQEQKLTVHIDPGNKFDSENLLNHAAMQNVENRNILIVRGQSGREILGKTLQKRGAKVSYISVYKREHNKLPRKQIAALDTAWQADNIDYVTVLSVATMESLVNQLMPTSVKLLHRTMLVAPSTRVIKKASALLPGIKALLSTGPRATDIVETIQRHQQRELHK